jgi:hypothetical protein
MVCFTISWVIKLMCVFFLGNFSDELDVKFNEKAQLVRQIPFHNCR